MAYSPTVIPQPVTFTDTTANISIAANSTASGQVSVPGWAGTYVFQLSGTWSATLQVQVTRDGTTWTSLANSGAVLNLSTGAYQASGNITANGIYQCNVAGVSGARVITTAYTSGTINGIAAISPAPPPVSPSITVGANSTTLSGSVTSLVPGILAGYSTFVGAVGSGAPQTPTALKASTGSLYQFYIYNPNTTAIFLQFFFQTVASTTLGTTAPTLSFGIEPSIGKWIGIDCGHGSGTALTIGVTTTWNGGTSPTSPAIVNAFYI